MNVGALVAEFVPLNRRRTRGDPPLTVQELERWMLLREMLEHAFGNDRTQIGASKRQQLRVPTHLRIGYAAGSRSEGSARNLSEGGCFIETKEMLEPGTPLELEIDAGGGGAPIRTQAEVAWTRELANASGPAGMGIRFHDPAPEIRTAIERLFEGMLSELASGNAPAPPEDEPLELDEPVRPSAQPVSAPANQPEPVREDDDYLDFLDDDLPPPR